MSQLTASHWLSVVEKHDLAQPVRGTPRPMDEFLGIGRIIEDAIQRNSEEAGGVIGNGPSQILGRTQAVAVNHQVPGQRLRHDGADTRFGTFLRPGQMA